MTIWWRGYGWLVPLAPILGVILGGGLAVAGLPLTSAMYLGNAVFAAIVFVVGRSGNGRPRGTLAERIFGGTQIRDAIFGRSSTLRHAFLGIRMEYGWVFTAIVCVVATRDGAP